MASGLFALLDDIVALMDDIAVTTKIASKKAAGILGDDLAVNAEKSTGFISDKELPVLWAITKGSFLNKLIIVPLVLVLNVYFPIVIKIVLMIGGAYLAYEGVEKIIHFLFKRHERTVISGDSDINQEEIDQKKIRNAIQTDFILSLEIVIIALSAVLNQDVWLQITTVCIVAFIATVGVYGTVALIVRLDDVGFMLIEKSNNKGFLKQIGTILVKSLPVIIKLLSVIGTIALITVAGGLFLHNIDYFHHLFDEIPTFLASILLGIVVGLIVYIAISTISKFIHLIKNKN
ncbi:MAG: DUF808 domain-containing protein [Crocinitomicaceae bacterium]|nr:DUF808 domain-containing protein [Crocinitomicaceae bacterium]